MKDVSLMLTIQLIGIAITGYCAQFLIIKANSIAKPSIVMPFGYVSVTFGFFADVFLFNTSFTLISVVGMILTSAGLMTEYLMSKFNNKLVKTIEEEKAS